MFFLFLLKDCGCSALQVSKNLNLEHALEKYHNFPFVNNVPRTMKESILLNGYVIPIKVHKGNSSRRLQF